MEPATVALLYGIGIGVSCVVAIGVVGYIIYRATEEPHKAKSKSSNGKVIKLTTIDDLKSENPELRRRNVNSVEKEEPVESCPQPPDKVVEVTQTTGVTMRNSIYEQGTQTFDGTLNNFHQETQTSGSTNNNIAATQTDLLNISLNDQVSQTTNAELNDQDSQTTNSLLNIGNNMNIILSDEDNVSRDGVESVFSGNSLDTICTVSSDTIYPAWQEMTKDEQDACICKACGTKKVTTVTYPCKHPYMCDDCAPYFFQLYNHRCPKCRKRIKSYDNI